MFYKRRGEREWVRWEKARESDKEETKWEMYLSNCAGEINNYFGSINISNKHHNSISGSVICYPPCEIEMLKNTTSTLVSYRAVIIMCTSASTTSVYIAHALNRVSECFPINNKNYDCLLKRDNQSVVLITYNSNYSRWFKTNISCYIYSSQIPFNNGSQFTNDSNTVSLSFQRQQFQQFKASFTILLKAS